MKFEGPRARKLEEAPNDPGANERWARQKTFFQKNFAGNKK